MRSLLGTLVAVLVAAPPATARAESGKLNLHLEAGPAFFLAGWQAEDLGVGLFPALSLDAAVTPWLGIDVGAGYAAFFGTSAPAGYEPVDGASLVTARAGLRFRIHDDNEGYLLSWTRLPDHTGNLFGNLWADLHGGYVYTGGLHRFGADLGVGVELSLVNGLELGPFVRCAYVYQPDSANARDSEDAWMLVAGLSFSVAFPSGAKRLADTDGDGIYDPFDRCVDQPEDKNGIEDDDGCPDPDNDADGLPDAVDKCPQEPEDRDGFEDGDGCPDPDNDADGVLDTADRCPDTLEDADGVEDDDGCPDPDNDADGKPDAADACPVASEDRDGFEDDDGCPDPDNDADEVPDATDACPLEKETINGIEDGDGCPDKGLVEVVDGEILGGERIYFDNNMARVNSRSRPVLEHLANLLKVHPEYRVIVIQGHADEVGSKHRNDRLSDDRAHRVRDFLIELGVEADRLVVKGLGESRPWVKGHDPSSRSKNRRVELHIIEKGEEAPHEN